MLTPMSGDGSQERRAALQRAGLLHPRPDRVTAPLFNTGNPFFASFDKVQVKYEMLRASLAEGLPAGRSASLHGYSRAAFYLVLASFEEQGIRGLFDQPRGRRGPLKLTPEIVARLGELPEFSGAQLAAEVERAFGVHFHRRTLERARPR